MNKNNRDRKPIVKYFIVLTLCIVFLVILLKLGVKVKNSSEGIYFDTIVITSVHEKISESLKDFMVFISFLGSVNFYLPLGILLMIYLLKKKSYIEIIGLTNGVLGSAIVNFLVKQYYMRIRPENFFRVKETGFSFPSGHSMVAFSFYFTLVYIVFRNKDWDIKKIIAWIMTSILVVTIGFSRIYLGVHWPTDIVGGFSLGFIWLSVNISIVELLHKKSNRQDLY